MTVRRAFVDTPHGQVHVRTVDRLKATGVPLLLLHQSPASSLTYRELLEEIAPHRRAIAIDTPGFGESFRPATAPTIGDYGGWIVATADAMGIDRFDLFGLFTGAAIAAEIAWRRPERVRRLVLAGPPLFSAAQQQGFVRDAWPTRPVPDGSHLAREWQRLMMRSFPGVSFERRLDAFDEIYRGGPNAIWGEEAVAVYPLRERLPGLTQPVLVLAPEGIHGDAAGAAALIPHGSLEPIAWSGYAMLQAIPDQVAAMVDAFLDEG